MPSCRGDLSARVTGYTPAIFVISFDPSSTKNAAGAATIHGVDDGDRGRRHGDARKSGILAQCYRKMWLRRQPCVNRIHFVQPLKQQFGVDGFDQMMIESGSE